MSQAYELSGSVKVIGDVQSFNSGFSKRELVVTIPDGNYPQDISQFHKDRQICSMLWRSVTTLRSHLICVEGNTTGATTIRWWRGN